MIWDLVSGLALAFTGWLAIIALCVILGKIAGYFSRYKDV